MLRTTPHISESFLSLPKEETNRTVDVGFIFQEVGEDDGLLAVKTLLKNHNDGFH